MTQSEIHTLFERFAGMRVLVAGDVMLDSYVWGRVDRISPEAPVPVVHVKKLEKRLGGAANVALNLKALKAEAVLLSLCGDDRSGIQLRELLQNEGLRVDGLVQSRRPTTVKTRILGNQAHLLRVDEEDDSPSSVEEEKMLMARFDALVAHEQFDALVFEDYDKGMLSENSIAHMVSVCKEKGIPVAVDPKKRNFRYYRQVDLFKPNLKEIREGLKLEVNPKSIDSLKEAHHQLQALLGHSRSLITLSESGIFAADTKSHLHFNAHHRTITDVSGAGDTVIAVATLCLAAGCPLETIAAWSNLAGGLACEFVGVMPVERERLLQEVLKLHS
jgi:rfaE bifunctional protein kinase chain/domain